MVEIINDLIFYMNKKKVQAYVESQYGPIKADDEFYHAKLKKWLKVSVHYPEWVGEKSMAEVRDDYGHIPKFRRPMLDYGQLTVDNLDEIIAKAKVSGNKLSKFPKPPKFQFVQGTGWEAPFPFESKTKKKSKLPKLEENFKLIDDPNYKVLAGDMICSDGQRWQRIEKLAGRTLKSLINDYSGTSVYFAQFLGKRLVIEPIKTPKIKYSEVTNKKEKFHPYLTYYYAYNADVANHKDNPKLRINYREMHDLAPETIKSFEEKNGVIIFIAEPKFKSKKAFPYGW